MKDLVPIGCWQRWHRKQVSCQLFPLYSILREPGTGDKGILVSIWYLNDRNTLYPKIVLLNLLGKGDAIFFNFERMFGKVEIRAN